MLYYSLLYALIPFLSISRRLTKPKRPIGRCSWSALAQAPRWFRSSLEPLGNEPEPKVLLVPVWTVCLETEPNYTGTCVYNAGCLQCLSFCRLWTRLWRSCALFSADLTKPLWRGTDFPLSRSFFISPATERASYCCSNTLVKNTQRPRAREQKTAIPAWRLKGRLVKEKRCCGWLVSTERMLQNRGLRAAFPVSQPCSSAGWDLISASLKTNCEPRLLRCHRCKEVTGNINLNNQPNTKLYQHRITKLYQLPAAEPLIILYINI